MYAIFDIDNCIANDMHRRHLINLAEVDLDLRYKAYHDAMDKDEPAHQSFLEHHVNCGHAIAFITSRPEEYRHMTLVWLNDHFPFLPPTAVLYMRPVDNHQPSAKLKAAIISNYFRASEITIAYDDNESVLSAYADVGIQCQRLFIHPDAEFGEPLSGVAGNLKRMAETYAERNKLYGDSYKVFGEIMSQLFPDSLVLSTVDDWNRLGVLSMVVSKLTRYAANLEKGGHQDSAHDMAVYAAMLEELTDEVPF